MRGYEEGEKLYGQAVFPPFWPPCEVAERLARGERYVELLSVNGSVLLSVEPAGGADGAVLTLYYTPRPPCRECAGEWSLAMGRLARVLGELERSKILEPSGAGLAGGLVRVSYTLRPTREGDIQSGLEAALHVARSIAGVEGCSPDRSPDTEVVPLVDRCAQGRDSVFNRRVTDCLMVGLITRAFIDAMIGDYSGGDGSLYLEFRYRELYSVLEECPVSTASYSRILHDLEGMGAVRLPWKTGSPGPAGRIVKVNLKHYLILEPLMGVLAELAASGDPEAIGTVCRLLPQIEGVRLQEWRLYPGPYRRCNANSRETG